MGRSRKPAALHALEGTGRSNRTHMDQPDYPTGVPEKPAYFRQARNKVAAAEWDRIVPMLDAANIMSPVYRACLEAYCLCYQKMANASSGKQSNDRGFWSAQRELKPWVDRLALTPIGATKAAQTGGARPDSKLALIMKRPS